MHTAFKVCLLVFLGQLLTRCTPITLDSGINPISGPLSSPTDTSLTEIFRHNLGTIWYEIYAHEIKVGWAKVTKRERKGLSERCYRINLTGELRLQLNGKSHPVKFEIEEDYAIRPPHEII
jgi:hypothetical protein